MSNRVRWGLFFGSLFITIIAFGAWQAAAQEHETVHRGFESAARQPEMPDALPLAGINVDLRQYSDIYAELDTISSLGFVWLRQFIYWEDVQPQPDRFDWSVYDPIIEAVASNNGSLRLILVLDGTPAWARHESAPSHPFAPPQSPSDFGNFALAVAERYGDRVDFYQIWDEPNIESHWGEIDPNPAAYVVLLSNAYDAIHAVDDNAMVIAAALAPTVENGPDNLNDPAYLRAIYELGGADYFDAVAAKPYGFDFPPSDRTVDLNRLNFSRMILLREEMIRQGDGQKPLWGSNFGWNHLPDDWAYASSSWGSVSAAEQIAYTQAAFERAEVEFPWLAGLILQHWQPNTPTDDPIQGFAIRQNSDEWEHAAPAIDTMTAGYYPADTDFVNYEGDWRFGTLGVDGGSLSDQNQAAFTFWGDELAIRVRRGNYLAYLDVWVDGSPANALPRRDDDIAFLTLTSADRQPRIDLILVAEGLSDGPHDVVIQQSSQFGNDRWSIVGYGVGNTPPQISFWGQAARFLGLFGAVATVFFAWRLPWAKIRLPSSQSLRNMTDFALGLLLSSIVFIGALLTWQDTLSAALKRDLPALLSVLGTSTVLYYAPSSWLALIGILLTGYVIFSRPWVGVLLTIFWSAFFTSTLDPFYRVLEMVDVILTITLAATASRLIYDYAKSMKSGKFSLWGIIAGIKLHPLDICMLLLVGLGFISLSWSDLLPEAIRQLRIMIIGPAILYALIRLLRPNLRDLAFLAEIILFMGWLLSMIGIWGYISGDNVVIAEGGTRRLLSVYGSPNAFGLMMGRCLPFALAYLLVPVGQWRRILAGVTGLTMLVALALSQSVGAILLGVPAAFLVILLIWGGRRLAPVWVGLGALGGLALAPLSLVIPRIRQITDFENNTTVVRLNLWRSTAQLIEERPITGVGLDQFLYAYRSRYILPEAWEDPDLSHPHNVLLDYWVRLGILGVLLGLAFQWYFWRQALQISRDARRVNGLRYALILGAMGAMAAFLAHGLVDMAHFNINLSYLFAVMLAVTVSLKTEESVKE